MRLRFGLAARFTAALLVVIVVAVGAVALLARRSGGEDFLAYVSSQMPSRAAAQMPGRGPAGGAPGQMRGPAAMVASAEEEFLRRLDRSLLTAAGVASGAALIVGLVASRHLTRPLRALQAAAQRMGEGDLTARVPVAGGAEVADLARTFNQMAEGLQLQEAARRALVADVAHDLRTPVTVIQGTVDALVDGVFPATEEHFLSIRQETERLAQLVCDLRDVSLADAGQLRLERRTTNLVELASRAVRRHESNTHEIRLHPPAGSAGPLPDVDVDPIRIEQVLDNLLSNAIRHTPPGGGVAVDVARMDPTRGERMIALTVTDTGGGIAPEDLPRVFDRFYRADPARTRAASSSGAAGSGLGLAIVKGIVEAHGGQVWAENAPGGGARFTVALPVVSNTPDAWRSGNDINVAVSSDVRSRTVYPGQLTP